MMAARALQKGLPAPVESSKIPARRSACLAVREPHQASPWLLVVAMLAFSLHALRSLRPEEVRESGMPMCSAQDGQRRTLYQRTACEVRLAWNSSAALLSTVRSSLLLVQRKHSRRQQNVQASPAHILLLTCT
ncbi:unnamed protein product [Effrenium voratum]|nr:unnamed protein product [Effrenium voratum]